MKTLLIEKASLMGVQLSSDQVQQFIDYMSLLLEWNEKINLTAITEPSEIINKHFLDSISCLAFSPEQGSRILDLGTGAGFPGIPIKIIRPDLDVTLMDALNKRLTFLNAVIEQLGLQTIRTVHGRAEEAGRALEHREQYQYVYARAVARMNVLCEYCLPFVKLGGFFVCQKGPDWQDEVKEAANAIKLLGGAVADAKQVVIPGTDYTRWLVLIRKEQSTPAKFPRHGGKISKSAL